MNSHDDNEAESPVAGEPRPGHRSASAMTIGAFSAGVMFIVILLYLAY